jgi:sigma-B regulation protein RsbU (phosphoserine phosphatase)
MSGEAEHTIVIAEPDDAILASLRKTLESEGYEVLCTTNGIEAIQLVRDVTPEVLVCDWQLPGINGRELCEQIKEDPLVHGTYIVVLSNENNDTALIEALDSGADEFLIKPCEPCVLNARIRVGLRFFLLQEALSLRNEQFRELTARWNDELEVIAKIQNALLPHNVPQMQRIDFSAFYMPSTECGGDYYDVLDLGNGRYGFVIADVSGHGAPSMVAMALIRQTYHLFAHNFAEPQDLLAEMNRLLFEHLPTDQFATMFYGIVDTANLEMHYSSTGHNPPLWYRNSSGMVEFLEGCEGFPLKLVTKDATYKANSIHLEAGDQLVLYTDGIPECFNAGHAVYGGDRLRDVIAQEAAKLTAGKLQDAIIADVMRFADEHPYEDDLTLAVLRILE